MKLIMQLTVLATFLASLTQAQMRGMVKPETDALVALNAHRVLKSAMNSKSHKSKSKSKSHDSGDTEAEGELGCRKECSDKRFTVVCDWEATRKNSKKSHKKSRRQLGEAGLDFEDEVEEESRELKTLEVGGGRRLKVELEHVKCVLGVGKEDSDDSSEDYEEFAERVKFPSNDWMLKIKSAEDEIEGEIPDYYKFTTKVKFEDLDLDSSSVDELTATLEIELLEVDGVLIFDDSDIKFDC